MLKSSKLLFIVILGIILYGLYSTALQYEFTYLDDQVQIVENPFVQSWSLANLYAIFTNAFVGMYQPLTTTAYLITHQIAGLNPIAFHLTSLLFHFFNCMLLLQVLRYFFDSEKLCFLLVALFALHPMQVESIAWSSAFSNILYSFFLLFSLSYYLRYIQDNKSAFYLKAFIFFIAACLSKSMAVTLPIILLVIDYYYNLPLKKSWKEKIPFLVISILFGIITILSRETAGHLSDLSVDFSWWDRIFLVSHSILFYPISFLLPIQLSAFYPYPEVVDGALPLQYYLSLLVLIAIGFFLFRFHKNKLMILGVGFFLISISLVLQLIPFGNQLTTDRYIYLPMLGILLLLGMLVNKWNKSVAFNGLFLVPLALAYLTYERTSIWENDETIWLSVLETHPQVAQAHNNLGSYAYQQGDLKKAFNSYNKAIEIQANYADAYSNRGNLYSIQGNSGLAMADFNKALQLRPHADAYFNRANEYANAGLYESAINDYTRSLELVEKADGYANRAYTYLRMQNFTKAKADIVAALAINPNFDQAVFLGGIIAQQEGDTNNACQAFLKAAKLGNKNAQQAFNQSCR